MVLHWVSSRSRSGSFFLNGFASPLVQRPIAESAPSTIDPTWYLLPSLPWRSSVSGGVEGFVRTAKCASGIEEVGAEVVNLGFIAGHLVCQETGCQRAGEVDLIEDAIDVEASGP